MDVVEHYNNLTLKTLSALKFALGINRLQTKMSFFKKWCENQNYLREKERRRNWNF